MGVLVFEVDAMVRFCFWKEGMENGWGGIKRFFKVKRVRFSVLVANRVRERKSRQCWVWLQVVGYGTYKLSAEKRIMKEGLSLRLAQTAWKKSLKWASWDRVQFEQPHQPRLSAPQQIFGVLPNV